MKIPCQISVLFLFLNLFKGLLSFNPDSVIVQSPEDNDTKTAQIRSEDEIRTQNLDLSTQKPENKDSKTAHIRTEDGNPSSQILQTQSYDGKDSKSSQIRSEDGSQPSQKLKVPEDYKTETFQIERENGKDTKSSQIRSDDDSQSRQKLKVPEDYKAETFQIERENGKDSKSTQYRREGERQFSRRYREQGSADDDARAAQIRREEEYRQSQMSRVQGPVDNAPKSAQIRKEADNQYMLWVNSETSQGQSTVRVLQPFNIGNRRFWLEVARERYDTIRDFDPVYGGLRGFRTSQPNFRRTTQPSIPDMEGNNKAGGNRPPIPQNNVNKDNNNRESHSTPSSPPPRTFEVEEAFTDDNDYMVSDFKPTKRISPDSDLFSTIVNNFAFKMMQVQNLESNFVISPLSIFIAMSMCYLGSDGRTKAQLEQALGMNVYSVHNETLHLGIKDLLSLVMTQGSGYQLFVANGMFLDKNFTANEEFMKNIKIFYDADVKNLDFGKPQITMPEINNWVSEKTRNMITNIISSPPSEETRLILLNAIFFKGVWKIQFPPNLTHKGNFHLLNGSNSEVPFMILNDETFPAYRSDDHSHSFIKLPYEGDQVSMIIALPYRERQRPLSVITDEMLCQIRDNMADVKFDTVTIPKFRLEFGNSIRRPLEQLGVRDIFNRNDVDLRKLRKENDVYVSDIMHKAVVDVNEEGTTASAVTEVKFVALSWKNKTNFIVDRPFSFYILHEPSGLVMFHGKVFEFDVPKGVQAHDRRENSRGRPRPSRIRG